MVWTKASVDSGEHTYAEALQLMNAAGYSEADLIAFLMANPGDLYRVPEAFDLGTGGVDPASEGQTPRDPIPYTGPSSPQAPPLSSTASTGGPASLFLTLDGLPSPSSAQPNRPAASLINAGAPTYVTAGGAPSGFVPGSVTDMAPGGGSLPWWLLLVAGLAGWYLLRKG